MKRNSFRLSAILLLAIFPLVAADGIDEKTRPGASANVTFTIGNGAEPESIDPQLISGQPEIRIALALFEGLTVWDPETCAPLPGIAETWDISADGLTYTFHLRPGLVWSDGTALTAQQLVDSWLRMISPALAAEYAYIMTMVVAGAAEYNAGTAGREAVRISAPDSRTFVCTLVGPTPYFLGMLPNPAFMPVPTHVISQFGSAWTAPGHCVSNGPFTLDIWTPNQEIVLVQNSRYWDAINVRINSIQFLPIEDVNTAYSMFQNGSIDWDTTVPLDSIDEARWRSDYQNSSILSTYYYSMNNQRAPLNDVRVRQALSLSLDRRMLVDYITRAGQIPAYSIVPPMAGYEAAVTNGFDIARARILLAEAGFPSGRGFPRITLIYNTSEGHRRIAEFAQQQWMRNLGINVSLQNIEWATFVSLRQTHDYTIARDGWGGDYLDPNTFLDLFMSGATNNDPDYRNPDYDALIRRAAAMPAGPARLAVLREAERMLIERDQAIIPLYYYTSNQMIDTTRWGGWYNNSLDNHPWKNIYRIAQ